eukprot:1188257-Prorocentrum_minimum.AAC.1
MKSSLYPGVLWRTVRSHRPVALPELAGLVLPPREHLPLRRHRRARKLPRRHRLDGQLAQPPVPRRDRVRVVHLSPAQGKSASQPVIQSASRPVSKSASQQVSQSVNQSDSQLFITALNTTTSFSGSSRVNNDKGPLVNTPETLPLSRLLFDHSPRRCRAGQRRSSPR